MQNNQENTYSHPEPLDNANNNQNQGKFQNISQIPEDQQYNQQEQQYQQNQQEQQQQQQNQAHSQVNRVKEPIFSPSKHQNQTNLHQSVQNQQQQQPQQYTVKNENIRQQVITSPTQQTVINTIPQQHVIQSPQQNIQYVQQPIQVNKNIPVIINHTPGPNTYVKQDLSAGKVINGNVVNVRQGVSPPRQTVIQTNQVITNQNNQNSSQQQTVIKQNDQNENIDNVELIRTQTNRIQHLEDRINVITTEYKRIKSDLDFKNKEVESWQQGYEQLQNQLNLHMERVREQDRSIDEMKQEKENLMIACDTRGKEVKDLQSQLKEKNEGQEFWRQKCNESEDREQLLQQQQNQIKILEQEVQRLKNQPPTIIQQQPATIVQQQPQTQLQLQQQPVIQQQQSPVFQQQQPTIIQNQQYPVSQKQQQYPINYEQIQQQQQLIQPQNIHLQHQHLQQNQQQLQGQFQQMHIQDNVQQGSRGNTLYQSDNSPRQRYNHTQYQNINDPYYQQTQQIPPYGALYTDKKLSTAYPRTSPGASPQRGGNYYDYY